LADASSNKSTGSKRYFKNKQDIDLRKANELKRNEDNAARILALAEYAKKAFPDLKISLGCAKPGGKTGHMLEACLIKTGIDSIAFPSEKTIIYAKENNIDFEFIESCCALL
ncbi:MAG: hypothetical protein JW997_00360, partial [Actinobacteria bacterium]|nr:hypothetical protein [Actinomycetota bacterium]